MFHFTVVIPTLNRVEMLMRAVKSARAQALSNLEILVVDDSSNDTLQVKLREFFCEHGVHYLYSGGKRGGAFCRNKGIENAKSDLVAFLDDDDEWECAKLLKQFPLMKENSVGLCYTGVKVHKHDSGKARYIFHPPKFSDQYKSIMDKNFIGTTSSVVVRKSILEEIGGFDSKLSALQDYDLYIRILEHWRAVWINEPLTIYHDHCSADKVSANRSYYLQAAKYLSVKYNGKPFYKLLNRSLKKIELLKIIRSKKFLKETVSSLFDRGGR